MGQNFLLSHLKCRAFLFDYLLLALDDHHLLMVMVMGRTADRRTALRLVVQHRLRLKEKLLLAALLLIQGQLLDSGLSTAILGDWNAKTADKAHEAL